MSLWKKRIIILWVAALLCAALCLCPETVYADLTEKVRITTKDPYTRKKVGAVELQIYDSDGNKVMSVRTDGNGQKTVFLKPGDYHVTVARAPKGYAKGHTTQLTVKKGKSASPVIRVLPQFTCKVKVMDSEGKPVCGATVRICGNTGITNEDGIATIRKVAYGKYDVTVNIQDGWKTYVPYSRQWSLKAGAGQKIRKSIRLPEKSQWSEEPIYVVKKPVIYLYSKKEMNVSVRLGRPEDITTAYPAYPEKGWNVSVHPGGGMTDLVSGRELYSLYWEGKIREAAVRETGFVVKGKDTVSFLEEKLAYLGLNDHETEEFIIYWLPLMQGNAWNYIRFATGQEINENMPLIVIPAADRILRVWMDFTPLDMKPDGIQEQELIQVNRNELGETDFYVVEWGGMIF